MAALLGGVMAFAPNQAYAGKACVVSGFKLSNKVGSLPIVMNFGVQYAANKSPEMTKTTSKDVSAGQSVSIKFDSSDTKYDKQEVWGKIEYKNCTNPAAKSCRKDGTKLYVELDPDSGKPRGPIWHYKLEYNADPCRTPCQFENTKCVAPLDSSLTPGK